MPEIKRKILNVIFWMALAVGIVMILWRIFGNSPSDLAVIVPFIILSISKIWAVDDGFNDLRYHVKSSFDKVKEERSRIENKIDNLPNKLGRK